MSKKYIKVKQSELEKQVGFFLNNSVDVPDSKSHVVREYDGEIALENHVNLNGREIVFKESLFKDDLNAEIECEVIQPVRTDERIS
jgi:hypothetical protein